MLTILHVSDLHFGPPFQEQVGEALLRFAHRLEPELIVASGDFTQRAKPEQFAAARAFLDRFPPAPLVVTPGNHDVPLFRVAERLFDPYRHYHAHISPELDSVVRLPDAVVVALNSTAPRRATVNGRVHRWQLDFAREAFTDVPPDMFRIVVAHHHFAPPPDFEKAAAMMKAKRALDAFTAMRVDLVLGGHLHRAYLGNSLDVYAGMDREHGIVIVQSGTSTSRRGRAREREKNSFNVIRIDGRLIRVTHYMYFDVADGFLPTSRHIFYRGGRPPIEGESMEVGAYWDESEGVEMELELPLRSNPEAHDGAPGAALGSPAAPRHEEDNP
jgi:3',5'-cyclic AMP phosphodiesterase CpdA